MKRYYSTLILLIGFSTSFYAQNIDLKLLETLQKISLTNVYDFMVIDHGYEQGKVTNNGTTYAFTKIPGSFGNAISISVTKQKDKSNKLDIFLASNYKLSFIKKRLLKNGFTDKGKNSDGFMVFKKGKTSYLITEFDEVKAIGITVISE